MSDVRLYVRDAKAVNLRQFTALLTRAGDLNSSTGACTDALFDEPLLHGIARQ